MISVTKTAQAKPHILRDTKIGNQLKKINTHLETHNELKIGSTYSTEKVKKALAKIYEYHDIQQDIKGIKCAYCESKIDKASTTEEVEHYRPKDGIKSIQLDENGTILRKENGKIDFTTLQHEGYYWLCYEWTNLLIACRKCNGHKSNYFPIQEEDKRISDNLKMEGFLNNQGQFQWSHFRAKSEKLKQEKRLLLNPELDEVEKYFTFNSNGRIDSDMLEGKVSIAIYDLDRNELRKARLGLIKKLESRLEKAVTDFYQYGKPLNDFFDEEVKDLDNPKRAYSRFGYYIKHNFDSFVINRLKKEGKNFIPKFLTMEYENWKSSMVDK